MKKKGYYYALDVTLAIIIIIVGVLFILAKSIYEPEKMYTYQVSTDMVNVLHDTKLKDVCTSLTPPCACNYDNLTMLCNSGDMLNEELSLLEYLGELYSRVLRVQCAELIEEIFLTNKVIPGSYNFTVMIVDVNNPTNVEQLYPLVP